MLYIPLAPNTARSLPEPPNIEEMDVPRSTAASVPLSAEVANHRATDELRKGKFPSAVVARSRDSVASRTHRLPIIRVPTCAGESQLIYKPVFTNHAPGDTMELIIFPKVAPVTWPACRTTLRLDSATFFVFSSRGPFASTIFSAGLISHPPPEPFGRTIL